MDLTGITTLTFDCYGTLIDWERGILDALRPLRGRAASARTDDAVLLDFADCESRQQAATPAMLYADVLTEVHGQLAERWGVARDAAEDRRFGASIGDWPAFPDTAEALAYLKRHFRLVILSNVDRASFARSNARLGVAFDAIYTAQDIGSYKPDPRNFVYLIERLAEQGVGRGQILHVAQSLFHDHAPANAAGLRSVWIDRRGDTGGWGATAAPPDGVRYDARFPSLEAFAAACRGGG
jgi:2-haloalkanoic acid dehalogenase type II